MQIVLSPELSQYLKEKDGVVLLDVAQSQASDVEFAEVYCRLLRRDQMPVYLHEKGFRAVEAPGGTVLLPRFPLHYEETLFFTLKKWLCFRWLAFEGAAL